MFAHTERQIHHTFDATSHRMDDEISVTAELLQRFERVLIAAHGTDDLAVSLLEIGWVDSSRMGE